MTDSHLARIVVEFLDAKRDDFLSDSTIAWYRSSLRGLACHDFDARAYYRAAPSAETARNRLRAMRIFFGWAERNHGIENPTREIRPPRKKAPPPRVLTQAEMRRLWQAASEDPVDLAIVATLMDTGIRAGELASLSIEAINEDGADVVGKTGQRPIPLSPLTRRTIMAIAQPSGPVFVGRKGPLTPSGLEQRFRRIMKRAGLSGRKLGPHTLRHTFATLYLRQGGDLVRLQMLMGHSSIRTTSRYVHLARADVWEEHRRLSPLHQAIHHQEELWSSQSPSQEAARNA